MFTGLIQGVGIVLLSTDTPAGRRLTVSLAELADRPIAPGDSLAISGVCLTALQKINGNVAFDVVSETLARTTLGQKRPGDRVNLEFALRGGDPLGGHFVQGHVEAVAEVLAIDDASDDWRITFATPPDCAAAIVSKGSITIDGVSMTIADVLHDRFSVAVIPTTLAATTLGALAVGDAVNLETDIIARTVVHVLRSVAPRTALVDGAAHKVVPA